MANNTSSKKTANRSGNAPKKNSADTRKKSAQQVNNKTLTPEQQTARRQRAAIILMAAAAFLICVAFIKGESVWNWMHCTLFGLFGFCAYIWPFMLLGLAVIYTLNKPIGTFAADIAGVSSFVLLLGSAIHIFSKPSEYLSTTALAVQFKEVWAAETLASGGFFGTLIGGGLAKLFGKTGAGITVVILLVVLAMLLTGTTLIGFVKGLRSAFVKIGEVTAERMEANAARREQVEAEREEEEDKKEKVKKFSPPPTVKDTPKADADKGIDIVRDDSTFSIPTDSPINIPTVNLDDAKPVTPTEKAVEQAIKDSGKVQRKKPQRKAETVEETSEAPDASQGQYVYPPIELLNAPVEGENINYSDEIQTNAQKLLTTLESFNVKAEIIDICRGPSVTRYELVPDEGIRISKITKLADDIALRLAASGVRIEAPIPNKSAIGIEVPNRQKSMVCMREIIDSSKYRDTKSKLYVALGKDIAGNIICTDIAKMPHMLIAGTTGSGKSVCLNSMIVSILFNASPEEVKLLMIDPKQVEFTIYNGIAHLEVPVVSDPRKAAGALGWAVAEMERRYKLFSENNVRDIGGYNRLAEVRTELKKMPQYVIFIDELSDLMMVAPNEVEDSICRLAQMARAAGMHLVIATQRPSVDVITGIIKANIPSRIALSVSSQIDSRTILDTAGAEKLLGNGDMLFSPIGLSKPVRVQGCYISEEEIEKIVDHIKSQMQTTYNEETIKEIDANAAATGAKKKGGAPAPEDTDDERDEMFDKAVEVVVEAGLASTTMLQKRLKLGYARASRVMDELFDAGIIGPYEGSKPRKVLITKQQWYEMNALSQSAAGGTAEATDEPQEVFTQEEFEDIFSNTADEYESVFADDGDEEE